MDPRSGFGGVPMGDLVGEIPSLRRACAFRPDRHGLERCAGHPRLDGSIRERVGLPDRTEAAPRGGLFGHRRCRAEHIFLHRRSEHGIGPWGRLFLPDPGVQFERRVRFGGNHRIAFTCIRRGRRGRRLSFRFAPCFRCGRRRSGLLGPAVVPPRGRMRMEMAPPVVRGKAFTAPPLCPPRATWSIRK